MTEQPPLSLFQRIHWERASVENFQSLARRSPNSRAYILDGPQIWLQESPHRLPSLQDISHFANEIVEGNSPILQIGDDFFFSVRANGMNPLKKVCLRSAFDLFQSHELPNIILGSQLVQWSISYQHCNFCGANLQHSPSEVAKICTDCQKLHYPQLQPVVIVLIFRKTKSGVEVLLARGLHPRQHYSCIAGFVEPGETLENSLRREVQEEVGVQVHNLKYFGSQPWPFPNQLMLAFTAEWLTGEIRIDPNELTDAQWFSHDNLPILPPTISIARQMIDAILN